MTAQSSCVMSWAGHFRGDREWGGEPQVAPAKTGTRSDSVSDEERADLDAILIGGLAPHTAPPTGSLRGEPGRNIPGRKRDELATS